VDNFVDAGIARNIDDLGRIVLPLELRKKINVSSGEEVSIFVDEVKGALMLVPVKNTISNKNNDNVVSFVQPED
jgi:AbrB family looped-hinge helix DNA binding protein